MKIPGRAVRLLRTLATALAWPVRRALRGRTLDEGQLRRITDGAGPDVLIGIVSPQGRLTHANRAARTVLGDGRACAIGRPVLQAPWWPETPAQRERIGAAFARGLRGQASRFDAEVRAPHGAARVLDLLWMPLFDGRGRVQAVLLSGRDVTERVRAQAHSAYLATHDAATGLPNRQSLLARIAQRLQQAEARRPFCILVLGLDRLNWVNEALGPTAGDSVLQAFAQRLRERAVGATAARLGGDVFALLVDAPGAAAHCEARKLQQALHMPLVVQGRPLHLSCCVGVAQVDAAPAAAQPAQAVLQQAETALCEAKSQGPGSVRCHTAAPPAAGPPRLFLLSDLHGAVARNELVLHYQPQWDAARRCVVGAEALVRWEHPVHGRIAPDRFIPIAEDSGLILPIGAWVLRQACAAAVQWHRRGFAGLHVSVNVSPRQLRDQALVAVVRDALQDSGLPPACLVLEVTESALMDDVAHACALLAALRALGVAIALDDFGAGYSSLGRLRLLPLDLLKIDRSLVPDVAAAPEAVSITRAIITMAASLRLRVVAEGVESAGQLDLLVASGCHAVQGFHIARPLPQGELLRWLARHHPASAQDPLPQALCA
ncbi:putative bifunctional diguanylate cyclase/phosphodiesterase [Pseudorhodoferax sp.]|uniref:putative bifunctional diguanylate cyclase/phosphodiesterase n=1 Tax=Pseudorhodoferax sp. TaxID=1993553 RepID=UPI002DD67706|nr:EAL domain-containing protein [Pseudorhodoferax sp.]